jgi:hypothetical protein
MDTEKQSITNWDKGFLRNLSDGIYDGEGNADDHDSIYEEKPCDDSRPITPVRPSKEK